MRRAGGLQVGIVAALAGVTLGACTAPASRDAVAARAEPAGIAPELVLVTTVDGFDLMTQSVGVMGTDGMSAVYRRHGDGATVLLTTAREATPGVARCAAVREPAGAAETREAAVVGPVLRCFVEREGGAVVQLDGDGVDAATLKAAGEAVRVPTPAELGALFAEVPPVPHSPVERGDLPPGDGAPDDEPGAGG
nr:hypothetical protein [uncultured Actinotalea sp.]